ncbi:universal stress protein [Streptantibioticus ferralitis]|uniref:Universal stress protein n=1 Tax=Streptantibioticus ferralitis TaxID=236510 RepID=A0ABT5YXG7_9ACTN|nr:universal stress protein [Streptantibioticus ferralitis]MDF2255525.1 universal stress protein [Streptantibioticus ferralitis]
MPYERDRVIVGVSGSPTGLWALQRSAREARRDGRALIAVLAWEPPGGEGLYRRAPCPPLAAESRKKAAERLDVLLNEAFGGHPPGVRTELRTPRGEPGWVLCALADRPDDLLVVGGRRCLARTWRGRVTRQVLAGARCPVLVAPAPLVPREVSRQLRRAEPADFALRPGHRTGGTA